MNHLFRNHARLTAFHVYLSGRQYSMLLWLDKNGNTHDAPDERDMWHLCEGLVGKGLIEYVSQSMVGPDALVATPWKDIYPITDAGRLAIGLLHEAGFAAS